MTARFRVTAAMLYAAQRDLMRQVPWIRRGGYFVIVGFPLVMIGITLTFGGTLRSALANNGGLIGALWAFWLLGIPLVTRWSATRTLRSTPAFQGTLVYELTDGGLRLTSDVSASDLTWAALTRVVETRKFFLLFQNKAMALFIPKAALGGPQAEEDLRTMIARHLGARATLTPRIVAPAT